MITFHTPSFRRTSAAQSSRPALFEMEKNLKELEKEITCSICHEHYEEAKILPCLHYFCKQCIINIATKTGKDCIVYCPECYKEATFSNSYESELKPVFFIDRLKAIFYKRKKVLSGQLFCEMCSKTEAKAETFCQHCDKFTCGDCEGDHSHYGFSHTNISLKELQEEPDLKLIHSSPVDCPRHTKLMNLFCTDCSKLVCIDCIAASHKDHNIEQNMGAVDRAKEKLIGNLKPLKNLNNILSQAVEMIGNAEDEVKSQSKTVIDSIEASVGELKGILDSHKRQLLKETDTEVTKKVERLVRQKKNFSLFSAEVSNIFEFILKCLRYGSDAEVMDLQSEIEKKAQEVLQSNITDDSVPEEQADLMVDLDLIESFRKLCQAKFKLAHPSDFIHVDIANSVLELNKESEILVSSTIPGALELNLRCHLKSLASGLTVSTAIEVGDPGQYHIVFTPSVRGRHELSVHVNNHPVPGSPFIAFVSNIITGVMNKPVRPALEGVNKPWSVAINSACEIVVAECEGDVIILNEEGKKIRAISPAKHRMNSVRSLAVDKHDNIYFVDDWSNRIGKCDTRCSEVHVKELEQKRGPGYIDIAVSGTDVMVTEQNNQGQIVVFDLLLNYVRCISGQGKVGLRYLCLDSKGNVYASDNKKKIQVLSMTGHSLASFNCVGGGVNPWMIHVFDQYIYVADLTNRNTAVYTTLGEKVTTLGCYGSACTDQDGFVFICDFFGSKLYCY